MYYEEKMVDGVMCYRTDQEAEFKQYEIKELSSRYQHSEWPVTKIFMINLLKAIGNIVIISNATNDQANKILYITDGMIAVLNGKATIKDTSK